MSLGGFRRLRAFPRAALPRDALLSGTTGGSGGRVIVAHLWSFLGCVKEVPVSCKMRCLCLLSIMVLAIAAPHCVGATVRHYYIAAEDVTWDYAPSEHDLISANELPRKERVVGTKWKKTRYVEYTDASFHQPKPQPPWLGLLGPVIRAEVGDTIIIDFLNRSAK